MALAARSGAIGRAPVSRSAGLAFGWESASGTECAASNVPIVYLEDRIRKSLGERRAHFGRAPPDRFERTCAQHDAARGPRRQRLRSDETKVMTGPVTQHETGSKRADSVPVTGTAQTAQAGPERRGRTRTKAFPRPKPTGSSAENCRRCTWETRDERAALYLAIERAIVKRAAPRSTPAYALRRARAASNATCGVASYIHSKTRMSW
jgi:hypothetical protein